MAKNEIAVRKTDTIFDELDELHKAISQRAYDLFRNGSWSDALDNWLKAETELITKPAVELTQKDGRFDVVAAVPGVDMKDLVVEVTRSSARCTVSYYGLEGDDMHGVADGMHGLLEHEDLVFLAELADQHQDRLTGHRFSSLSVRRHVTAPLSACIEGQASALNSRRPVSDS